MMYYQDRNNLAVMGDSKQFLQGPLGQTATRESRSCCTSGSEIQNNINITN